MNVSEFFGACSIDRPKREICLVWADAFQPNNRESTLGFHTAYTCPERNRDTSSWIDDSGLRRGDSDLIKEKQESTLGMHLASSATAAFFINALNILGYLPLLGLISCAVRLIAPLLDKKSSMWLEPEEVRQAHFIRGAFEGVGLGLLYLIPDLIVTVKRFAELRFSNADVAPLSF